MGEDLYEQKFNILFVIFVSTMAIPFIPTFSENVYIKEPKPYCGSALPGEDCGQAPDTGDTYPRQVIAIALLPFQFHMGST